MKAQKKLILYKPKALIAGERIEAGLTGWYAGVPDRGYKGHPFKIVYYKFVGEQYTVYELKVEDWNRAVKFRRFMDQWGRGAYTLGYFKMAETI